MNRYYCDACGRAINDFTKIVHIRVEGGREIDRHYDLCKGCAKNIEKQMSKAKKGKRTEASECD